MYSESPQLSVRYANNSHCTKLEVEKRTFLVLEDIIAKILYMFLY